MARRKHTTPLTNADKPNETGILLSGDATRTRRIQRTLGDLRPPVRSLAWSVGLLDQLAGPITAVILAAPIVDVPLPVALREIRERCGPASVPVFAVVDSGLADDAAYDLYVRGFSAVVGWPHDAPVLPRILVESIAANQIRGPARSADEALERLVRTHLKLLQPSTFRVSAAVRDGILSLSGSIPSLWDKRETVRIVATAMGIHSVVDDNLLVARSPRTDRQLLELVRNALKATHQIDCTTLSPNVDNGYVTLAGTVESRDELDRIEDALVQLTGIRGIEKLTTISRRSKSSHRSVARRLEQRLADTHPEHDVDVSYFEGVAVLSGRARSPVDRHAIVSAIAGDEAVRRVVDKIDV